MSRYTDLTPYHNAGIPAFAREFDGQEWVFTQVHINDNDNGMQYISIAGFGEPEDIEDFPELFEFDQQDVTYWFVDLNEALTLINNELWEDNVLLGFVEVDE